MAARTKMGRLLTFDDIPEESKDDLLAWFNTAPEDVDDEDRQRLADLYLAGQFEAFDCANCGERCYAGYPNDWKHFQGVLQQDFASYPGNLDLYSPEALCRMCDHCRAVF